MAETISYLATLTPHASQTPATAGEGEVSVWLSVLSATHRNATERWLTKLAGGAAASDATAVAAVVTAINALA